MTKIKIFKSVSIDKLENDVNDFIKYRDIIDIKFNSFHENSMYNQYVILIIYKEQLYENI